MFNDGNMLQPQLYMFNGRRAVAEREMACAEDDDDQFPNLDLHV